MEWLIDRQAENWGLTAIMDEYVLFSRYNTDAQYGEQHEQYHPCTAI
ncbi:hypothetical protein GT733_01920 [Proteus mirabilis]|nr:hypothetical protein GJR68_00275 [Proteus mirabilis]QUY06551.1 hypothetical protein GT733_01920 [Proteus mirabilis]